MYSSYRPAGWDIHLHDSGAAPRTLAQHAALEYEAAFSPDGRWLVFTSERDGNPSLFALDLEHDRPPRLLVQSDAMEDQATVSPDGRWIAFVSTADGNADIYLLPFVPDSTQHIGLAKNLTRHPAGDFRPAFSPDSRSIAFSSNRDWQPSRHPVFPFALQHQGDIYRMDLEGSTVTRLTATPGWDGAPVWSPDGETIYFYSQRESSQEAPFRIWAMGADGSNPRPVSPPDIPALSPAVMANGRIAFATWVGDPDARRWRIASVAREGGQLRWESDASVDCMSPAFRPSRGDLACHGRAPERPDDSPLAHFPGPLFVAGTPSVFALADRSVEVYGMRRAFAAPPHPFRNEFVLQQRRTGLALTSLPDLEPTPIFAFEDLSDYPPNSQIFHLRWSADGAWIMFTLSAFAAKEDQKADVWMIRPDGSGAVNLTSDSHANDGLAEFSPDGTQILLRSGRTGDFDIYLMDADGGNLRNLTTHPARETFPAFSPLGNQIAFTSDRDGTPDEQTGRRTHSIYTLDLEPDGSPGRLRRITNNAAQDAHVQYSPDGEWLIYTSGKHGISDEEPLVQTVIFNPQMYGEIYAYRLRDGLSLRLTHNKWEDGAPLWAAPARE